MDANPWILPEPVVARVVKTAAFMWLAARALLAVLGIVALGLPGRTLFVVAVTWLTWYDVRVTREDVLLANLAVPPALVLLLTALVAGGLESTLGALLADLVQSRDLAP